MQNVHDDNDDNENHHQSNSLPGISFKIEPVDEGIIEFLGEEKVSSELDLNIISSVNNWPFIFNIDYTVI